MPLLRSLLRSLGRRARAAALSFALRVREPGELFALVRELRVRGVLTGAQERGDGRVVAGAEEPNERSFTFWTPTRVKLAQARSETGDLREAADLCMAILGDDRMQAVLGTRVRSLLGLPLTFEEGTGRRRRKAAKALEAEEDWWAIFSEAEEQRLFTWALLLGAGLGQLRHYEVVDGKRVVRYQNGRIVPKLKTWHPRYLRQDDSGAWKLKVKGGGEITITPGDGEWILVLPYGDSKPAMYGLWRGLARLWLLKSFAIDDWASYGEDHGRAIKWVQPPDQESTDARGMEPPGSTPTERQNLAAEVAELIAGGVVATPAGWKLSLIEAKANTWEVFRGQIDFVNTSAAITVLGQNLSTEVKGGSYAAAQTHDEVRVDLRRFDAEVESTTTRAQVLRWWAALNFGDPEAAPWPKRATEPPIDKKALAETWKTVAEAIAKLKGTGRRIPDEEIEDRFGMPLEPDEDDGAPEVEADPSTEEA